MSRATLMRLLCIRCAGFGAPRRGLPYCEAPSSRIPRHGRAHHDQSQQCAARSRAIQLARRPPRMGRPIFGGRVLPRRRRCPAVAAPQWDTYRRPSVPNIMPVGTSSPVTTSLISPEPLTRTILLIAPFFVTENTWPRFELDAIKNAIDSYQAACRAVGFKVIGGLKFRLVCFEEALRLAMRLHLPVL
jgi:hypothetical protein